MLDSKRLISCLQLRQIERSGFESLFILPFYIAECEIRSADRSSCDFLGFASNGVVLGGGWFLQSDSAVGFIHIAVPQHGVDSSPSVACTHRYAIIEAECEGAGHIDIAVVIIEHSLCPSSVSLINAECAIGDTIEEYISRCA